MIDPVVKLFCVLIPPEESPPWGWAGVTWQLSRTLFPESSRGLRPDVARLVDPVAAAWVSEGGASEAAGA